MGAHTLKNNAKARKLIFMKRNMQLCKTLRDNPSTHTPSRNVLPYIAEETTGSHANFFYLLTAMISM